MASTKGRHAFSKRTDNTNRLTVRDTQENTVDFSYYNDNRLDVRTLVGVGTSTYSYDNADRVTSVAVPGVSGSETTSYTYDSANRMLTTTYANRDVATDTYDSTTADLDSVVHATSGSSTIASYSYTYDSDGRKAVNTLADGSYYDYGYDNAGQLTSESLNSGGSGTIGALHGYGYTYTYDAAGNRATKYNGGTTDTYSYDSANKLTSVGVKSYSYDNSGNCTSVYNSTSGVTVTLGYDGENRMISASDSASTFSDTYSYNGMDQRVGKVDNGGTFAYTRQDDAIDSSVLADGAAVYNHGVGGSSLISENRSGASKYYHSDALGSTGALTNSSESVTDTHVTDAFGMAVTGSGSTPTPFGFVGQGGYQTDADTGLMLCGHRFYDDSTGRFLSRDPICDGYNWYTYCDNDPVNEHDDTGLFTPPATLEAPPSTTVAAEVAATEETVVAEEVGGGGSPPAQVLVGATIIVGGLIILGTVIYVNVQNSKYPPKNPPSPPPTAKPQPPRKVKPIPVHEPKDTPPSQLPQHQKGIKRKKTDRRGGEKGDTKRPY